MSNTVFLYAATGEILHRKSLSTADPSFVQMAKRLAVKYHWSVPILWVDIDYPLIRQVRLAEEERYPRLSQRGHHGPRLGWNVQGSNGLEAADRIVSWGGTVWTEVERSPRRFSYVAATGWRLHTEEANAHLDLVIRQIRQQLQAGV